MNLFTRPLFERPDKAGGGAGTDCGAPFAHLPHPSKFGCVTVIAQSPRRKPIEKLRRRARIGGEEFEEVVLSPPATMTAGTRGADEDELVHSFRPNPRGLENRITHCRQRLIKVGNHCQNVFSQGYYFAFPLSLHIRQLGQFVAYCHF